MRKLPDASHDMSGDTRVRPDPASSTGDLHGGKTPRWVKVSSIIAIVIVVLVVIVMLISGGEHGPGRHMGGFGAHKPTINQGDQS